MNISTPVSTGRQVAAWLVIAAASVAGCRSVDNAQVDLMERELRQQEDYIYELEDYLVEYSEKLRRCRCSNETHARPSAVGSARAKPEITEAEIPEPELADDTPPASEDVGPVPELADEPLPEPAPAAAGLDGMPDRVDQTPMEPDALDPLQPETIDIEDLDDLNVPDLEIGPNASGQTSPPADAAIELAAAQHELAIPDPLEYLEEESPPSEPATAPLAHAPSEPDSRGTPDRVVIRRIMADDPPSPEADSTGLLVVVELQNHLGEPMEIDGEASVMVLTREQTQRRVARWDFLADEAAAAWQSSILGDGLHLLLPMEKKPLDAGEYELWSRIVTANGDKLLAKAVFQPGQLATLAEAEAMLEDQRNGGAALAESTQQSEALAIAGADTPRSPPQAVPPPEVAAQENAHAADSGWKPMAAPIVRAADLRSTPSRGSGSSRAGGASWTRSARREPFPAEPANARGSSRSVRAAERWTPFQ